MIQVYSPKGGTGCTTLATNLALALHGNETRTILVDGNLQFGDVAVYLNEVGYRSITDLIPRVDDLDAEVISSVLVTHDATGMDAMVAPIRPELAEKVTGEDFYKILQYLRRIYSYIIVDTSMALNDVTLSTLDAADLLILVITQEIPTIKNCRLFLSVLDALHIPRERLLLTLNRYDRQVALSPEKISENIKLPIVSVLPNDPKLAIRSENQGAPFVYTHKNEPLSKAVLDLTETVKSRLVVTSPAVTDQARLNR